MSYNNLIQQLLPQLNNPLRQSDVRVAATAVQLDDHQKLLKRISGNTQRWFDLEAARLGAPMSDDSVNENVAEGQNINEESEMRLNSPTIIFQGQPEPDAVKPNNMWVRWVIGSVIVMIVMLAITAWHFIPTPSPTPTTPPTPVPVNTGSWQVGIEVQ